MPVASSTPILTGVFTDKDADQIANMKDGIPLGRLGQSDDIASGVMFLLSDEAAFITWVDLSIEGGGTAA